MKYILRMRNDDSFLYVSSLLIYLGMPELNSNMAFAHQFNSYVDAENFRDKLVFHFEILEI